MTLLDSVRALARVEVRIFSAISDIGPATESGTLRRDAGAPRGCSGSRRGGERVGPDADGALPSEAVEPTPHVLREQREDFARGVAVAQTGYEKSKNLTAVPLQQPRRRSLLVACVHSARICRSSASRSSGRVTEHPR